MDDQLLGYQIRPGSTLDRAMLVKFMQRTYGELLPGHEFSHLADTVERYLSADTLLLWVDLGVGSAPVACLWVGNAIDQLGGYSYPYIFLLYVEPEHRRRGIAKSLMGYLENLASLRSDRQIGLQVFGSNTPALNLYQHLGYQIQSLGMIKMLGVKSQE
jgi:ribosomal protein S18 acetylase RimI-like enzyme